MFKTFTYLYRYHLSSLTAKCEYRLSPLIASYGRYRFILFRVVTILLPIDILDRFEIDYNINIKVLVTRNFLQIKFTEDRVSCFFFSNSFINHMKIVYFFKLIKLKLNSIQFYYSVRYFVITILLRLFQLNKASWYFFMSKIIDLLDTVSNPQVFTLKYTTTLGAMCVCVFFFGQLSHVIQLNQLG